MHLLNKTNLLLLAILLFAMAPFAWDHFQEYRLTHAAPTVDHSATHYHADFAFYINGAPFDFSQSQFQSSKDNPLHPNLHFHDGNGKVIHYHDSGLTLGELFDSLGLQLADACVTVEDGTEYCSNEEQTLKFFVNQQAVASPSAYIARDLDQILLTYGDESTEEIQAQLQSLSNDACIYSEVCPERGEPPTENCVGGLGSKCEV